MTSQTQEVEKHVYVAHFDILGMGAAIKKDSWNAWQNILDLSEALDCEELPIAKLERQRLNERYFSDTVLITSEDDGDASLHTILARSLELFRCAIRQFIPLRGGIAHGTWFERQYDNKDLFSGTSLNSAYELGESQQLLGVSVCSKIYNRFYNSQVNPFTLESGENVILPLGVPVKGDTIEPRFILNWPAVCGDELKRICLDDASLFSKHFWTVNKIIEMDSSVLMKYENTLKLIRDVWGRDVWGRSKNSD